MSSTAIMSLYYSGTIMSNTEKVTDGNTKCRSTEETLTEFKSNLV